MGVIALFVAAPIVLAAPAFTVPEWIHTEADTSISAYHDAELAGLQRGTTFTNEYLPRDVFTQPGANEALLADYADGYPMDKSNVPDFVTVRPISSSPTASEWSVNSDESFTMEIFYWEGWTAEIDGQAVPITPSQEHGFITFEVPDGVHTVKVYMGTTAPRFAGILLSVFALVGLLALAALTKTEMVYHDVTWFTQSQRNSIIAGGLIAVVLIFIALQGQISWQNTAPGNAPTANSVQYNFDDDLQLIGYDLRRDTLAPGDSVELTLYWYATATSEIDFSSFVHIAQEGLPPLAQSDKDHPGGRAISEWWSPEGYIRDVYVIPLSDDFPAGTYNLRVGLYTCELMPVDECGNGYRPTVTDAGGETIGDSVTLTTIVVEGE
ncbi:MAG: hypothetical protein ACPG7F_22345, partial [Aggregatilineales bacterium]